MSLVPTLRATSIDALHYCASFDTAKHDDNHLAMAHEGFSTFFADEAVRYNLDADLGSL